MKSDLSHLVETLPNHEERCSVSLKSIHADGQSDDGVYTVSVRCEVHARDGDSLPHPIEIRANVYDDRDRVIGTETSFLDDETFFDFETAEMIFFDLDGMPAKIRLYPKAS
jgi:hypothetical protein